MRYVKFELSMLRSNLARYGARDALGIFIANTRFTLGYRIGGFTSASKARR